MKDKIQELLEQASEYAAANATGDWEVGPAYQDIFNKKFAELIVKECARVVNNLTEMDNPIEYRNTYATGADILEHFGVEE